MAVSESFEPTTGLRFVKRDGKYILQQAHIVKKFDQSAFDATSVQLKWRDVPTEEETV